MCCCGLLLWLRLVWLCVLSDWLCLWEVVCLVNWLSMVLYFLVLCCLCGVYRICNLWFVVKVWVFWFL